MEMNAYRRSFWAASTVQVHCSTREDISHVFSTRTTWVPYPGENAGWGKRHAKRVHLREFNQENGEGFLALETFRPLG
jgi:hypothetical protein